MEIPQKKNYSDQYVLMFVLKKNERNKKANYLPDWDNPVMPFSVILNF